nr:PREDICTED: protein FAM71C-like isoform X1 [Latimeria chalumnae]|eukprot:XP_006013469.2 PREDICTED: protein FAM71C-like isoform X1 [Latimeria chalumnae]
METESFRIRLESMSVDPRGGHLQKYLYNGEYDHFRHIPIFESDFIQVSKKGGILDIHKKVTLVTIGVMATSPALMLPNIMLLAKHVWQATLEHCACMPGCRLCGGTAPRTRSKEHGVQMELTSSTPLLIGRRFYLRNGSSSSAYSSHIPKDKAVATAAAGSRDTCKVLGGGGTWPAVGRSAKWPSEGGILYTRISPTRKA